MMEHHSLPDYLTTAVVVLDKACGVRYLNESAESLLGESLERARNRHVEQFALLPRSGTRDSTLGTSCETTLDQGAGVRLYDVEMIFPRTRKTRSVDCFLQPVTTSDGPRVLLELVDRGASLVTSERSFHGVNLVRRLAHEIRNPLGGIRGAAQLLGQELGQSGLAPYISVITRETDRLSRLVGSMQASASPGARRSLNIHCVLEHVRALIVAESDGRYQVQTDYDPSLPDICGNEDQLIQAVLNIARNAAQSLRQQEDVGLITFRSRITRQVLVSGGYRQVARVDIIDSGPGIDRELAEYIFDPMISGRPDGSGLGLAITAEIVRSHGGVVTLQNTPGHTTFSVYLGLAGESDDE